MCSWLITLSRIINVRREFLMEWRKGVKTKPSAEQPHKKQSTGTLASRCKQEPDSAKHDTKNINASRDNRLIGI